MARILSIDYGKKRTGLAVTDPLQIIAGGLATVATCDLMTYLQSYVARESVERIVVGEPKQLNGEPSENLPRVKQFVAAQDASRHSSRVLRRTLYVSFGSQDHD